MENLHDEVYPHIPSIHCECWPTRHPRYPHLLFHRPFDLERGWGQDLLKMVEQLREKEDHQKENQQ